MNLLNINQSGFDDTQLGYLIPILILVGIGLAEAAVRAFIFAYHLVGVMAEASSEQQSSRFNQTWQFSYKKFTACLILLCSLLIRLIFLLPCILLLFPTFFRDLIFKDPLSVQIYYLIIFCLFTLNALLILIPLICGTCMIFRRILHKPVQLSHTPMIFILVPVYNEIPDIMEKNLEAILQSDYPKDRIHLVLAFDSDSMGKSYLVALKKLRIYSNPSQKVFPRLIDTVYAGMKVSVCRFVHQGKRLTQMSAYKHLHNIYMGEFERDALIFLIDSDIILEKNAISSMVCRMDEGKYEALTGFVLINEPKNLLEHFQDIEYFQGQTVFRYFESLIGGVTCLPGALTVINFHAFRLVSNEYFNKNGDGIWYYHLCHLGEDRFLTALLLQKFRCFKLGFCYLAAGHTDAPKTIKSLVIQRRRWLLGTFATDANMLSDPSLWRKFPFLMIFTLLNNSTDLGCIVLALFIAIPLLMVPLHIILIILLAPIVLVWILCSIGVVHLGRMKLVFIFPLLQLFRQFLSPLIAFYSILTFTKMTWGGPRTVENVAANLISHTKNQATDKIDISGEVEAIKADFVADLLLEVYQSYAHMEKKEGEVYSAFKQ